MIKRVFQEKSVMKGVVMKEIERKILLNPGPSTTTDTVKFAQVVPDICPREKDFSCLLGGLRDDLVKIVHGDLKKYVGVIFCGSGTLNIDVCINSLVPENKKLLVINNGTYSARAAEIAECYGIDLINLKFPITEQPDLLEVERVLNENPDIAVVYTTYQETLTGLMNPIKEIGALAHKYNAVFIADTTSVYAMRPINIEEENIDFLMASAQKGLMAFTGLSFIVGRRDIIEQSKDYPKRSYYCNLYMQYEFLERTGEMHFTPPVQTIYAVIQALKEYWEEGEEEKWARHTRVYDTINAGLEELGFRQLLKPEIRAGLVSSALFPDDENWNFEALHDYCYERGFTIYPGFISVANTFRLCSLGAIDKPDIDRFFVVFKEALKECGVTVPVRYKDSQE